MQDLLQQLPSQVPLDNGRGGSFDFAHPQARADYETHGLVQAAGPRVALAHMQKGPDATAPMSAHQRPGQSPPMAPPSEVRVRAHAADLLQAGKGEALAVHRDQPSPFVYT